MWLPRKAEVTLDELLRADHDVVTVHGLAGIGSSSIVARALSRRTHYYVDASVLVDAEHLRRRFETVPRATRLVWLDQVHDVELGRSAIEEYVVQKRGAVVIAARAPIGLNTEQCVPIGLLAKEDSLALLRSELRRVGVQTRQDLEVLSTMVDGWPIAIRAAAQLARAIGIEGVTRSGLLEPDRSEELCSVVEWEWQRLPDPARNLLSIVCLSRGAVDAEDAASVVENGLSHLDLLVRRGLLVGSGGLVRAPLPLAAFVLTRAKVDGFRGAKARYIELLFKTGERAQKDFRRRPGEARVILERLKAELVAVAADTDPSVAVRATLILEPLLNGRLGRQEVMALYLRARALSGELEPEAQAGVLLALARAHIGRGEHESAKELLTDLEAIRCTTYIRMIRRVYLAHIAAWRGELKSSEALLNEASEILEEAAPASQDRELLCDAEDDLLLQRTFVAYQAGDLDETERFARLCCSRALDRPSPRLGAIARRFSAEVLLRRDRALEAVAMLRTSRDELSQMGDEVGSLFLGSRLVEALRAAGNTEEAAREAEAGQTVAQQAEEGALELAVLGALDGERISWARVAELAWRAQIPILREQAKIWMSVRRPDEKPVLRLASKTKSFSFDAVSVSLAKRQTLWRILERLTDAHKHGSWVSAEELFKAGWLGRTSRTNIAKEESTKRRYGRCVTLLRARGSRRDQRATPCRSGSQCTSAIDVNRLRRVRACGCCLRTKGASDAPS